MYEDRSIIYHTYQGSPYGATDFSRYIQRHFSPILSGCSQETVQNNYRRVQKNELTQQKELDANEYSTIAAITFGGELVLEWERTGPGVGVNWYWNGGKLVLEWGQTGRWQTSTGMGANQYWNEGKLVRE